MGNIRLLISVKLLDREDYDQVVIQFGGEGHFVPGLFYFDDLVLLNPSGVINQTAVRTNVYPNPASDVLYLENAANLNDVSIYSVVGQLIYQSEKVNSSINISDFPAGIYTLHANGNDGKQYFAKFIVK